ncbi:hypothetical protein GCM10010964_43710 [Caldovatus sediminis]|uniref:Lipoprotein n=1 Tax=Caldovatus sediminis TaxID=2041189 RepID=A0A8J3ED27_9PROT|nr:hypothetical protein [Caldovatus sediminis]GGG51781.1 hypothetical protein GCM10010964_43710 [Caldovatus sediminis]
MRTTIAGAALAALSVAACAQFDQRAAIDAAACAITLGARVEAIARNDDLSDREKAIEAAVASLGHLAADPACQAAIEALRQRRPEGGA